jgi:Protein of unknown function (DUF2384)
MVTRRIEPGSDWKSTGRLFEGESRDIYEEVRRVLGSDDGSVWLREPNVRFGGKAPQDIIKAGQEFWVRDVLRSYLYIGSS